MKVAIPSLQSEAASNVRVSSTKYEAQIQCGAGGLKVRGDRGCGETKGVEVVKTVY